MRHILAELGAVSGVKLPEFDKDGAALLCAGCMLSGGRITYIGAGRIVAMFILKRSLKYDEFFAPGMGMSGKVAARRIADDRGGAGDLGPDPVQHAAVDAGHGRGHPRQVVCVDQDALSEIGVEGHEVSFDVAKGFTYQ